MPSGSTNLLRLLRSVGLIALLLGGLALSASVADRHYPLAEWLFWHYALAWVASLVWAAACVSAGNAVTRRLLGAHLPFLEHFTISFAVGVFVFELALYVTAAVQLLVPAAFYIIPLLLIAAGAVDLSRTIGEVAPRLAYLRRAASPRPVLRIVPIALGLLGLGMVYFIILTPENIQFDARWKHMAMAEDLVASGGIRRFPEATLFAVRPHFASVLYSWAFLAPTERLFDRMILGAHLEYVIFCVTTVFGIPAVVRRLVPGADAGTVWAARFLFPGVFLYDGTLSGGADHIGALFGPPIYLLTVRAWRDLSPRSTALLAVLLPAAALVKDTVALMFVAVPAAAIAARAGWFALQAARGRLEPGYRMRWLWSPLVAIAVCLLLWSPHWLKNLVLYGDPLYPMLATWFKPGELLPDTEYLFEWGYKHHQFWRPSRDLAGVLETLKALATWPFVPHNWAQFHGNRPIIGAAMTLLVPCLLLLRGTRRVWVLLGWVHVQIFLWYWVHHQDRYLQALMPMIAAVAAAIIVLLWRLRETPVRLALLALLGFVVVDGLDVYFIPNHAMVRQSIVRSVVDLLGRGYQRKYAERFAIQSAQVELGAATPKDALILVHEDHNVLGYGRRLLHDFATWQYTLDYGQMRSPRSLWQRLRDMGVSHIVWAERRSKSYDSIAADLMFFYFAERYGEPVARRGSTRLVALPSEPPAEGDDSFDSSVLVLGCPGGYRTGLYQLEDLTAPSFGPRSRQLPAPRVPSSDGKDLAARARFAVADLRCHKGKAGWLRAQHTLAAQRRRLRENPEYELYVPKGDGAQEEPEPGRPAPAENSSETGEVE